MLVNFRILVCCSYPKDEDVSSLKYSQFFKIFNDTEYVQFLYSIERIDNTLYFLIFYYKI